MTTLLDSLGSVASPLGPGVVVRPRTERELAHVLMVLKERGASLGVEVTLDRAGFAHLGQVHEASMTIEAGAGVAVSDVEAKANALRLSLGALPPAAWRLDVGALVESPTQAFRVVVPGRLEPLAARVTGVLADGRRVASPPGPRHATGPDLASLLLGAGGVVGLVTSATLRLVPLHEHEQRRTFSFSNSVPALEALREALSAGVLLSRVVVRSRAGRALVEITLRGAAAQVDRELQLFGRVAERGGGRFEGQGQELPVDGDEAEVSWAALARALSVGGAVELYRVSLSSVVARGVAVAEFDPPSPLTAALRAAFDPTRALGSRS
ncbi:MAG: FAD-binding oxidoreductase [Myxococcus sp.]|nr:FAD-binding oxidoreductase [Myxococcus sp.]